jgi:hypothetical protein
MSRVVPSTIRPVLDRTEPETLCYLYILGERLHFRSLAEVARGLASVEPGVRARIRSSVPRASIGRSIDRSARFRYPPAALRPDPDPAILTREPRPLWCVRGGMVAVGHSRSTFSSEVST